jgi:hypothetical protein
MARTTLSVGAEPGARIFPAPWPVFDTLRPEAEELTWMIWGWIDATAKMDANVDPDLEERVHSSPFGVPMSWESLSDLLSGLLQIIDANFVGCRDPHRFRASQTRTCEPCTAPRRLSLRRSTAPAGSFRRRRP